MRIQAIFFEVPSSWSNVTKVNCWAWDASGNYTGGNWPGAVCTKVGTTTAGNAVYKWTWDGKYTGTTATTPTYIIFSANSGKPQQNDQTFKNGNYYYLSTVAGNVIDSPSTGISKITTTNVADAPMYNLAGQRVDSNYKGVVIQNGKKVVRK